MRTEWQGMRVYVTLGLAVAILVAVAVAPSFTDQLPGWSQEGGAKPKGGQSRTPPSELVVPCKGETSEQTAARLQMLERDLAGRDITNEDVLRAMGKVPRHEFVSNETRDNAYVDHPLSIGHKQTISQPYIVALMTQLADAKEGARALDIGTGSGYQAAVLGEICEEVYSIEIVEPLATAAKRRLAQMGYKNITVRQGDGYEGWPDKAPFDVIIVAAAPAHVPQPLVDQLAPGGKLVIPVGKWYQELLLIERDKDGKVQRKGGIGVRFVPMTGKAQKRNRCSR